MAGEWQDDWTEMILEDCMEAIIDYRGKTPKKTTFGIPLVTAKIIKGGRVMPPAEFIAPEDYDDWMRRGIPEAGDVVMTTEAPLGEVAQLNGDKIALAQRVITLRGKPDLLDNTFLKFLMISEFVQNQLTSRASGTTVLGIKQSELRKVTLSFPPLPEQRAIASILGALDDKIELNRRMNATLESLARAIFKSWFVDFDPVRSKSGQQTHPPSGTGAATATSPPPRDLSPDSSPANSPFTLPPSLSALFPSTFQDSDLGKIPQGWEVGPLTELAAEGRQAIAGGPFGSKLSRKHYTEFGVPVIRGANMSGTSGWFNDGDFVFVSDEKAETLLTNMAKPGDVVFTQRGTLGQVALIPPDARFPRYVISQSQMKMTCADGVPGAFVYLYFTQPSVINYITGNATASGVPHINLTFLREFDVLIPPREVLTEFGKVIGPILTKLTANERESLTLSTLRDALLPKLLSGELPVPAAQEAFA